jgi:hypothetical protein
MHKVKTYAVDFETYYDGDQTVTDQGSYGYFNSLSLEQIYLATVVAEDGRHLVGHPKDIDWSFFKGNRIVVWNASFEMQAFRRLRELGLDIPEPAELVDAADMAAYVGLPRSLKGAAETALGVSVDKSIRDTAMKGKEWLDMTPDFREQVMEYAVNDSRYTLEIWQRYESLWPEKERLLSKLTREWAAEGIGADTASMESAEASLKHVIWQAGTKLPWFNPDDPQSVPLSPKKLAEQCRDAGLPCPKSLALDSEDCAEWEDKYGEKYPWVGAMRDYRRANALLKRIEALRRRVFEGRWKYEIKYAGANGTLRWSGGGGINAQNLPAKELYGVKVRDMIVAPEGKVFVVSDLAQIEPRCLAFLAGEHETLSELAKGISPYIVYARQVMGLDPNETWDKGDIRYKIAKISVLGAGYQVGHKRFVDMLKAFGMSDVLTAPLDKEETTLDAYRNYAVAVNRTEWIKDLENSDPTEQHALLKSWEIIQTFRTGRPKLVALWKSLGALLKNAAAKQEDVELELPSGRSIRYRKCRFRRIPVKEGGGHEVICDIMRNGREMVTRIHGGICTENITQGLARDVFADGLLRLHEHGYKVALHVHDEVVIEVPETEAEFHRDQIERLMGISPAWAPTLPVVAEATICKKYSEAK